MKVTAFIFLSVVTIGVCFTIPPNDFIVEKVTDQLELNNHITIHLALKQHNVAQMENLLISFSNPKSTTYGKWMTLEEIANLISSPHEEITKVENWLRENK